MIVQYIKLLWIYLNLIEINNQKLMMLNMVCIINKKNLQKAQLIMIIMIIMSKILNLKIKNLFIPVKMIMKQLKIVFNKKLKKLLKMKN